MLLNVCCAPCALPIIEYLKSTSNNAVLFFYGPNIFPKEEYDKRSIAARKIALQYNLDFFEGKDDHEEWLKYVKQNLPKPAESYPENGERCQFCFRYRLKKTAQFAKENFLDEFATALSISEYKDTGFINRYGDDLAKQLGLDYRTFPLDPEEAHREGRRLSKLLNIYRQKYCGCEFSRPRES